MLNQLKLTTNSLRLFSCFFFFIAFLIMQKLNQLEIDVLIILVYNFLTFNSDYFIRYVDSDVNNIINQSQKMAKIVQFTVHSPSLSSEHKNSLLHLSSQLQDQKQWLNNLNKFFSISFKNIHQFSTSINKYIKQFPEKQLTNGEGQLSKAFLDLIKSMGIQLCHFSKNSNFLQMELISSCKMIVHKLESKSIIGMISAEQRNHSLKESLKDVTNSVANLIQNIKSSQAFDECVASQHSYQSGLQNNEKLFDFIKNIINEITLSQQQCIKRQSNLKTQVADSIFTLNETIILSSMKQYSLLSTLFKSLLEEVSIRFQKFRTSCLTPIISINQNISFKELKTTLKQYQNFIFNCTGCQINQPFVKCYTSQIAMKLSARQLFFTDFFSLLSKYVQILKNILNMQNRLQLKNYLKTFRKHPQLICEKTITIVQSIEYTSQFLISVIQKLVNDCESKLEDFNYVLNRMDLFDKRIKSRVSSLISPHNKSMRLISDLLLMVTSSESQQKSINQTFQNNVCMIIESLFVHLNQIHSKMLMVHQTYFGMGMREVIKHIKNWAKSKANEIVVEKTNKYSQLEIIKANNLLQNLARSLQFKNRDISDEKKMQPQLNSNQDEIIGKYYCIHQKEIGVLKIYRKQIRFVGINIPTQKTSTLIPAQKIVKITQSTDNLIEVECSSSQKYSFNCFYLNKFIFQVLRTHFTQLRQCCPVKSLQPKQNIKQDCLSSTLDDSSLQSEEELHQKQTHLQEQSLAVDHSKQKVILISAEQQKQRELRLKQTTHCKLFQNFSEYQFENTNCMHLLDILFGSKEYNHNGKKSKQFYYFFKDKLGQLNFKPEKWDIEPVQYFNQINIKPSTPLIFKRMFKFDHPLPSMGIPFLPKTCKSTETQSLIVVSKNKFIVDVLVQSSGAPYTDTFRLKFRNIFTNIQSSSQNQVVPGKVKLQTMIFIQWLKRTLMKSMVQKQAYAQTKMATEVYVKILNQAIKAYPCPKSEPVKCTLIDRKVGTKQKKVIKIKKPKLLVQNVCQLIGIHMVMPSSEVRQEQQHSLNPGSNISTIFGNSKVEQSFLGRDQIQNILEASINQSNCVSQTLELSLLDKEEVKIQQYKKTSLLFRNYMLSLLFCWAITYIIN